MNWNRVAQLISNEEACAIRATSGTCDKNCKECNMFRKTDELTDAYMLAMHAIEKESPDADGKHIPYTDKWSNGWYHLGHRISDKHDSRLVYCPICGYKLSWPRKNKKLGLIGESNGGI